MMIAANRLKYDRNLHIFVRVMVKQETIITFKSIYYKTVTSGLVLDRLAGIFWLSMDYYGEYLSFHVYSKYGQITKDKTIFMITWSIWTEYLTD